VFGLLLLGLLVAACGRTEAAASLTISAIPDQDPELLNRLYPALAEAFSAALGLEVGAEEDDTVQDISRAELEDAPIVRFVNKVLLDAIRKGASDGSDAVGAMWKLCRSGDR
jgi:ABC-type phosphate/phosphonate transport system substrate-binding protein